MKSDFTLQNCVPVVSEPLVSSELLDTQRSTGSSLSTCVIQLLPEEMPWSTANQGKLWKHVKIKMNCSSPHPIEKPDWFGGLCQLAGGNVQLQHASRGCPAAVHTLMSGTNSFPEKTSDSSKIHWRSHFLRLVKTLKLETDSLLVDKILTSMPWKSVWIFWIIRNSRRLSRKF